MLVTASLAPAASAASVPPVAINSGNPTCADLAPAGVSWTQLKLQDAQLANGVYSDGTLSVTISDYVASASGVPGTFDWASNIGVDAVFVKAGSSMHQLYLYAPETTGDSGLSPQAGKGNGISHISFCYDIDPIVAADPAPTPTPAADPTPTPVADPTPTPAADPTQAPEAIVEPTPTPDSGVLPDGEEQPECGHGPEDDMPPQDAVLPDGAVLPAIGVPDATLPPTDTARPGGFRQSDDWRIVLAGFAGLVFAALILTPSRHGRIRR